LNADYAKLEFQGGIIDKIIVTLIQKKGRGEYFFI